MASQFWSRTFLNPDPDWGIPNQGMSAIVHANGILAWLL